MGTGKSMLTILLLASAVLVIGAVVAVAQPAQPGADPFGQPPAAAGNPQGGPGGPGGRGGGMMGMPMMGMMGSPAIAVAEGFVFVVQGGALYKFDANTLDLVKKVQFEEPPAFGGFGGGGGRRGGGGQGGAGGGPGAPGGAGGPPAAPPQ